MINEYDLEYDQILPGRITTLLKLYYIDDYIRYVMYNNIPQNIIFLNNYYIKLVNINIQCPPKGPVNVTAGRRSIWRVELDTM